MPPKMQTTINSCFIWIPGGTFEPVSLRDVQEFPCETFAPYETLGPAERAYARLNANREITGTFTMRPHVKKFMMRTLYGWKARGPIRYRTLHRLWERRAACQG